MGRIANISVLATGLLFAATAAWAVEPVASQPAAAAPELPVAAGAGDATNTPAADVVSKTVSAARVVTCAIVFPLDQVRFSEEQVTDCMKAVNTDAVSYIHVIATSSNTGSNSHNLYLSNRRAGAIEAYLVNRYPGIPVHAFGGGENPKFGKMARIFIVENQGRPEDISAGVQLASVGKPELIERTTTKYVTRTEYKDAPKKGIAVNFTSGAAVTGLSSDPYRFGSLQVGRSVPWGGGSLRAGLYHRLLQSNDAVDINASGVFVARFWRLGQLFQQQLFFEPALEAGAVQANGRAGDWGGSASAGVEHRDYRFAINAARSRYLTTVGLGLGFSL